MRRYEGLSDLIGRIAAYAHLNYVTDTADPARAKLLGDIQDKLTAITSKLVFFTLELNQLEGRVAGARHGRSGACTLPAMA